MARFTGRKMPRCLWPVRPSSSDESTGVSVSAQNSEIVIEHAIVSANCLYSSPVVPGKNATGTNTASRTSDDASTAPVISRIASRAPSSGGMPFSWMKRAMFSMTTIASSTTSPVASVSPKSVSVLIENPSTFMRKNVPSSETGIVSAGISVVRQSCKNRKITRTTSPIAISSVMTTSLIDSRTKSLESNATW